MFNIGAIRPCYIFQKIINLNRLTSCMVPITLKYFTLEALNGMICEANSFKMLRDCIGDLSPQSGNGEKKEKNR